MHSEALMEGSRLFSSRMEAFGACQWTEVQLAAEGGCMELWKLGTAGL